MQTEFTTLQLLEMLSLDIRERDYLIENQTEVTARINAKLVDDSVKLVHFFEDYIFGRLLNKLAGDKLELENTSKYSTIDPHPAQQIEIGAILVSSWGYDQTNVDFYVVVEMTPKMIKLLPVNKYSCRNQKQGYSPMAGETRATKKIDFRSEVMKRKTGSGGWVKIDSCSSAHLWDGKKEYESWYA